MTMDPYISEERLEITGITFNNDLKRQIAREMQTRSLRNADIAATLGRSEGEIEQFLLAAEPSGKFPADQHHGGY